MGGEWEGGEKYFIHKMLTVISTNQALRKLLQNHILEALKFLEAAEKVDKLDSCASLVNTEPQSQKDSTDENHGWTQGDVSLGFTTQTLFWGRETTCCQRRVDHVSLPHFENKLCPNLKKISMN